MKVLGIIFLILLGIYSCVSIVSLVIKIVFRNKQRKALLAQSDVASSECPVSPLDEGATSDNQDSDSVNSVSTQSDNSEKEV